MKLTLPKQPFGFIATFLNARAPRERLFIVGFAAAFLFFLIYMFWLQPMTNALMQTIPALSSQEARLEEMRDDKKNAVAIGQKWDATKKELQDKESRIGASSEIAPLLENLSKQASESGVRITSLKPIELLNPAAGKLYFSVPIQIKATAGTHALGAFLMRLETGGTFFKVTDLKISANTADERKHLIEMMVETYRKA